MFLHLRFMKIMIVLIKSFFYWFISLIRLITFFFGMPCPLLMYTWGLNSSNSQCLPCLFIGDHQISRFLYSSGLLNHDSNYSSSLKVKNNYWVKFKLLIQCKLLRYLWKMQTIRSAFLEFCWPLNHNLNRLSSLEG